MKKFRAYVFASFLAFALSAQTVDSCLFELYFVKDDASGLDSALVAQTATVRWQDSGTLRFPFRLALPDNDSIVLEAAYVDDMRMSFGAGKDEVTVRGSPAEVVFPVEVSKPGEPHRVAVVFRLIGTVEKGGVADFVYVPLLQANRSWPVKSVVIGTGFQDRDVLSGLPSVSLPGAAAVRSESGAIVRLSDVSASAALSVVIPLKKDSLTARKSDWQVSRDRARSLFLPNAAAAAVILVAGGFAAFFLRKRYKRRYGFDSAATVNPLAVHPAFASTLCSFGISVTRESALACLLRCARKGAVIIKERKLGNKTDFLFVRNHGFSGTLETFESILLNAVLPAGTDSEPVAKWGGEFGKKSLPYEEVVRTELIARGWLDERAGRAKVRSVRLWLVFTLLFAAASPAVSLLFSATGYWPFGIPLAGAFLCFLTLFSFACGYAPLSAGGYAAKNASRGLVRELNLLLKKPESVPQSIFDARIEYAAGFGLLASWANLPTVNASLQFPAWLGDLAAGETRSAAVSLERAGAEAEEADGPDLTPLWDDPPEKK